MKQTSFARLLQKPIGRLQGKNQSPVLKSYMYSKKQARQTRSRHAEKAPSEGEITLRDTQDRHRLLAYRDILRDLH